MPGHAIPEPYRWSEAFQVLYKSMDEEHRTLFDGIFECNARRGDPDCLRTLRDRVRTHFRHEEEAMDDAKHECREHKAQHKGFEDVLAGLSVPIPDDKIKYAMQWLVDHITETDFKYKTKLKVQP